MSQDELASTDAGYEDDELEQLEGSISGEERSSKRRWRDPTNILLLLLVMIGIAHLALNFSSGTERFIPSADTTRIIASSDVEKVHFNLEYDDDAKHFPKYWETEVDWEAEAERLGLPVNSSRKEILDAAEWEVANLINWSTTSWEKDRPYSTRDVHGWLIKHVFNDAAYLRALQKTGILVRHEFTTNKTTGGNFLQAKQWAAKKRGMEPDTTIAEVYLKEKNEPEWQARSRELGVPSGLPFRETLATYLGRVTETVRHEVRTRRENLPDLSDFAVQQVTARVGELAASGVLQDPMLTFTALDEAASAVVRRHSGSGITESDWNAALRSIANSRDLPQSDLTWHKVLQAPPKREAEDKDDMR